MTTPAALLIATRNLRTAALARGPIWMRCFVAGCLLFALTVAASERFTRSAPGVVVLQWFGYVNLWVVEICGIALFPALIVAEREGRTWSLLRVAGIGPGGYLLGQSLSALVLMLLVILVQAPFLLLAVALGGTDATAVGASVLVVAVDALMVYALALLASARAQSVTAATWRAAILVGLATFVPAMFGIGVSGPFGILEAVRPYLATNLLGALCDGAGTSGLLARGLGGQAVLAVSAALLGWWRFDARIEGGARSARWRFFRRDGGRFPAGGAAVRHLAQRQATGGRRTWLLLTGVNVAACLYMLDTGASSLSGGVQTMMTLVCVLIVLAALLGAWSIRVHRLAGTLPLLTLTQPKATQWLHAVRCARWQTLGVLAFGLPVAWMLAPHQLHESSFAAFLVMIAAGAFLADAVGERCGLVVPVAPWAVALLIVLGLGVLMFAMGWVAQPREPEPFFLGHAAVWTFVAWGISHGTTCRVEDGRVGNHARDR